MKHKKLYTFIVILLFLALVSTLILGIQNVKKETLKNMKDYQTWSEQNSINTSTTVTSYKHLSFYEKLINQKSVNILILGDQISLSKGVTTTSKSWDNLLSSWIMSTYKSKVKIHSLGENGASIIRVNEILNTTSNINDFDLIITCFGQNDCITKIPLTEFTTNYRNLIKNLIERNNNAIILNILPNTLDATNIYRNEIKNISINNNLDYVDVLNGFNNCGIQSNMLINGDVPTDKGYKIYASSISRVIVSRISDKLILQDK